MALDRFRLRSSCLVLLAAGLPSLATAQGVLPLLADLGGRTPLPSPLAATTVLIAADVDGDGNLDLAAGYHNSVPPSEPYRLFLNDGRGRFRRAPGNALPVPNDVVLCMAFADVDGDGDLDLVETCLWSRKAQLYFNDGKGAFTPAPAANVPLASTAVRVAAAGDVDGDGDVDLVFGLGNGGFGLLLNDGTGRFSDASATRLPAFSQTVEEVVLADLDGDGSLDLVAINSRAGPGFPPCLVLLNDGKGFFTDATATHLPPLPLSALTHRLWVGDFDGGGSLDLLFVEAASPPSIQSRLHLLLNDGKGRFSAAAPGSTPSIDYSVLALACGDVDRDGDLDLIYSRYALPAMLLLNDGSGRFAPSAQLPLTRRYPAALALADFDGDGCLDLACGNGLSNSPEPDEFLVGDGRGGFVNRTRLPLPLVSFSTLRNLLAADLDRNGFLDLLVHIDPSLIIGDSLIILDNDGLGFFTRAAAGRLPANSGQGDRRPVVVDIDGDGAPEILGLYAGTPAPFPLLLNDGRGSFTAASAGRFPAPSGSLQAFTTGDLDGDGDQDILAQYGSDIHVFRNDGAGSFLAGATSFRPRGQLIYHWILLLGDVDGDGDLDLVIGGDGQNELHLNDGKGGFRDATDRLPTLMDKTRSVVLADVDGDRDLDLLFGNEGQNRLLLNDGAGRFLEATLALLPAETHLTRELYAADLTGDGFPDLVDLSTNIRYYVNKRHGRFTAAPAGLFPADSIAECLALADLDGDGDLDLAGFHWNHGGLLLTNLARQVHLPQDPRIGAGYPVEFHARSPYGLGWQALLPFWSPGRARIPLPPFGTFFLDPARALVLEPLAFLGPNGSVSGIVPLPKDPALIGRDSYYQALFIPDLAFPNLPWRFSNPAWGRVLP